MKGTSTILLLTLTLSILLISCADPQTSVVGLSSKSVDINSPRGKPLTANEVKLAIIFAGKKLGWEMKPGSDWHIVGTYNIKKSNGTTPAQKRNSQSSKASVDITYSPTGYTVQYKDSENIDQGNKMFSNDYNEWIDKLIESINTHIALLK